MSPADRGSGSSFPAGESRLRHFRCITDPQRETEKEGGRRGVEGWSGERLVTAGDKQENKRRRFRALRLEATGRGFRSASLGAEFELVVFRKWVGETDPLLLRNDCFSYQTRLSWECGIQCAVTNNRRRRPPIRTSCRRVRRSNTQVPLGGGGDRRLIMCRVLPLKGQLGLKPAYAWRP